MVGPGSFYLTRCDKILNFQLEGVDLRLSSKYIIWQSSSVTKEALEQVTSGGQFESRQVCLVLGPSPYLLTDYISNSYTFSCSAIKSNEPFSVYLISF